MRQGEHSLGGGPAAAARLAAGTVLLALVVFAAPDGAGAQLPVPIVFEPEPAPSEPPPSSGAPAPTGPSQPGRTRSKARKRGPRPRLRRLSNERTRSHWAFVVRRTYARRRPSGRSRAIRRLRVATEDGAPELVLVLSELRRRDRQVWAKVRLPIRPNGRTGWVPRAGLGRYRQVTTLFTIDRRRLRASLRRKGRRVWTAPVGIGQSQWPTPRGRFYIRERLIPVAPGGVYGSFAFGTSAYSTALTDWPGGGIVGIHGTNQPELIPGRISHGCVRIRDGDIGRLRRLMPLGTPLRVL